MASGPFHYRAAEELLDAAGNGERAGSDRLLAAATAHAQLAVAAALALPLVTAVEVELEEGPVVPNPALEWGDAIL
jgi:hypothetical protein